MIELQADTVASEIAACGPFVSAVPAARDWQAIATSDRFAECQKNGTR
jgi:hypothetical protein